MPTCYQPSATERLLRELVRHRAQLVRTSVKHKLRVHANLVKENKCIYAPFSLKGRQQLKEVKLSEPRRQKVDDDLEVIDFLELKIAEQDAKVKYVARSNPDVPCSKPSQALMYSRPSLSSLKSAISLAFGKPIKLPPF
ncbi:MAG: hypothetical protein IPK73_01535 [Candidatus Obscuribacter sp.]|nr:hypothetical protein [Candidatus Obscuribacter sp.]